MIDYKKKLNLIRHEEGGYYRLFYKSEDEVNVLSDRYQASVNDKNGFSSKKAIKRNAWSSIYYLLEQEDFSAWHRLKSDEIWHYYDGGSPIDLYVIDEKDELRHFTLGNPAMSEKASFQIVIKAGWWFAAEVRDKKSFALIGCTVSPAFEYADFELADRQTMIIKYKKHSILIERLTREVKKNK